MDPVRTFGKFLIGATLMLALAYADEKPLPPISNKPIRPVTRMTLIRGLNAEFIYLRRTLPLSEKGVLLKNGVVKPDDAEIRQLVADKGACGKPGDRGQITNVEIHDHEIAFEINGGPKKKTKWYQRIQVGGGGGMTNVAPGPDNSMAHGTVVILAFDKFVPDLTVDQAKHLLAPVFDFSSLSSAQAYEETLPPKVREALKNHQVLVGMNRDLVAMAKGRPDQKVREREETTDYEEWIYGQPPQDVSFVRFVGDEVVQVKTMSVDGKKLVRTEKEIDMKELSPALAQNSQPAPGEQAPPQAGAPAGQTASQNGQGTQPARGGPTKKPTLKRPGEVAPARPPISGDDEPAKVPYPQKPGETPPNPPSPPPVI
jgi:hypothetical protein